MRVSNAQREHNRQSRKGQLLSEKRWRRYGRGAGVGVDRGTHVDLNRPSFPVRFLLSVIKLILQRIHVNGERIVPARSRDLRLIHGFKITGEVSAAAVHLCRFEPV